GFLAGQEGCSHLNGLSAQRHRCDYSSRVCDPTGGNHGNIDRIDNLRDERHRAHQGIFSGTEKGTTMPSGFETGRGNRVHAGTLESYSFIRGCRRADRDDGSCATLFENLFWRNSDDEAEYRYLCIEQHASLIFEPNG